MEQESKPEIENSPIETTCYNIRLTAPWQWRCTYIARGQAHADGKGKSPAEALQACIFQQAEMEAMVHAGLDDPPSFDS